jgi:LAO/AO transport system kinase
MNEQARSIVAGDARALARAATGVENRDAQTLEMLRELPSGHARIVGITGPPGAGKSTLVDAIAAALRKEGKTIGIIAVDPSSRITGGAILGDRIRMQQHHSDPGIFIRSMATRGVSGGLARATADMTRLMDASGKDFVLIETVGVGQDEIGIAGLAQVTVVVLVPGMGDDIQAIKAGILEIADIFVINKSDHPGAERVERELSEAGRHAVIVRTVATEGRGIEDLLAAIRSADAERPVMAAMERRSPRLDHLCVAVETIDSALGVYRMAGLAAGGQETIGGARVARLYAGGSRIDLLEPAGAESPIARFLEQRGPGLHHVALAVPDLREMVDRLRASGAQVLDEPFACAGDRPRVFVSPASTGGVLLELIQESET